MICAALLLISMYVKAGSCSANGTGNWETSGTWSCGHVPGTGDDATIGAGITVTVNANNTVDIGNLNIFGTLHFTNGAKIDLGGDFTRGCVFGRQYYRRQWWSQNCFSFHFVFRLIFYNRSILF